MPDALTLLTDADVVARRAALRTFCWGSPTMPATLPGLRELGIPSPFAPIPNLARVDRISFPGDGETSVAWHVLPSVKRDRVIFLNCGHQGSCTPSAFGPATQRVLNYMIADGWSVVVYNMPKCGADHTPMFTRLGNAAMRYFLDPINIVLNYLQDATCRAVDVIPAYKSFGIIGASGGGWTGIVYGAMDPRITSVSATAGWVPLEMRYGANTGDGEQTYAPFYAIAGYRDLAVLCAYGPGRRFLSIHNDADTCCFGPNQWDSSRAGGVSWIAATDALQLEIRERLRLLNGGGRFTLYRDPDATTHTISPESLPRILSLMWCWCGQPATAEAA